MKGLTISILCVEGNKEEAKQVQGKLKKPAKHFQVQFAYTFKQAIERINKERFDVILLDLGLPDSDGLDTLESLLRYEIKIPVIILSESYDQVAALKTLQMGAQDYLVSGELNDVLLIRSIQFAMERFRLQEELFNLSLIDQLTGLYNRRGFINLAKQELKMAERLKKKVYLIYADLDNMKSINDQFGHREGDLTLIKTADLLRSTFRESDIIGRMGGDEFVVLALSEEGIESHVINRLRDNIKRMNEGENQSIPYKLSLGAVYYDPNESNSLDSLLAAADLQMYQDKVRNKLIIAEESALFGQAASKEEDLTRMDYTG